MVQPHAPSKSVVSERDIATLGYSGTGAFPDGAIVTAAQHQQMDANLRAAFAQPVDFVLGYHNFVAQRARDFTGVVISDPFRLGRTILAACSAPHFATSLAPMLARFGGQHRHVGATTMHYALLSEALRAGLAAADPGFTAAHHELWSGAYQQISDHMTTAAVGEAATTSANVVAREMLTSDLVRLTFAPDGDYPIHAGQHVTVRGPRGGWRLFSAVHGQHPDGTVTVIVRIVPGGETAAIAALPVGGRALLRTPVGSVGKNLSGDVVCIAGTTAVGLMTGVAREQLAVGVGTVTVYCAASGPESVPHLAELRELASDRLRVVEVYSSSGADVFATVAADRPTWGDAHVCFAGSPRFMRRVLIEQLAAGVSPERLRYDVSVLAA